MPQKYLDPQIPSLSLGPVYGAWGYVEFGDDGEEFVHVNATAQMGGCCQLSGFRLDSLKGLNLSKNLKRSPDICNQLDFGVQFITNKNEFPQAIKMT